MNNISVRHRFLYGIGYMGVLVPGIVFTTFVTYYYIQHINLNPAWVGVGFGVVSAWEALIAPFIGHISDRTRTKWGRRKPYVVLGIPIMVILLWLIFNPPFDASQPILTMIWFMGFLFLLDSVFMVIDVNWQAVNAEMNADLAARSQQGAIVGVLSMLGVAIAASSTLPLAGKFGWSTTAILIGLFSLVFGFIGLFGLKENPNFSKGQVLKLKESIQLTLKNKESVFFLGLATVVKIAMFSVTTMIPLFAVWVIGVPEAQSSTLLLASSGGMLIFFPIAAILTNKLGPRKTMFIGMLVNMLISALLFFRIEKFSILIVLFACYAVGFAMIMMSLMIILSDVIDSDAIKVGQRREGIFNSANSFMQRIGAFLFSVSMGLILNASGFNAMLNQQSQQTLFGIKALMAGTPLLVSIFGLLLLLKYPINDEEAKLIRDKAILQREDFLKTNEQPIGLD